jgi:putative phosphoribosyl transferase
MMEGAGEGPVCIEAGPVILEGNLVLPPEPRGVVIFAHGSGSSRFSPRNRFVASRLQAAGLGTLLVDLLTPEEEVVDRQTRQFRFDLPRVAERLVHLVDWVRAHPATRTRRVGLFGASTGGGAALIAAALRPDQVGAVVSRGGRPDLAGDALPRVEAPTLLLVGGRDEPVIELNREAMARLRAPCVLEIVPGATHLFEEPGTLEEVARQAAEWFVEHLGPTGAG